MARGFQTVAQNAEADSGQEAKKMLDSGISTRMPSHAVVALIVVLNPGIFRCFIEALDPVPPSPEARSSLLRASGMKVVISIHRD
jgi:hypothetical protein